MPFARSSYIPRRRFGAVVLRIGSAMTTALVLLGGSGAAFTARAQPARAAVQRPSDAAAAGVRVRVTGTVFDSLAMRPLEGAVVQLVDAGAPARIRAALTGRTGAFSFDSVPHGAYIIGFLHSRLDSLGLDSPLLRMDLREAGDVRVELVVPPGHALRTARCGGASDNANALLLGIVRRADGETLQQAARVRAQWTDMQVVGGRLERPVVSRYVTATDGGGFNLCVPPGLALVLRAFAAGDSSGFVELTMPRDGMLVRDLYIGAAERAVAVGGGRRVITGRGRVRGTVRDSAGRPVSRARVGIRDSGVEDTTDARGQFVLTATPTGTHVLDARALGFRPSQHIVDIRTTGEVEAEMRMDVSPPVIDTVRVRDTRRNALALDDFERRRKSSPGHFIDETQLASRAPRYVADIFRSTPGMMIVSGRGGSDRVLMRGAGGGGTCVPAIFLNGAYVTAPDGVLEGLVTAPDVRAVEIYARNASIPIQFEMRNGCGSIVVWTGPRATPAPRR